MTLKLPMDDEKARALLEKKTLYKLKEYLIMLTREHGHITRKKRLVNEAIRRKHGSL